MTAPTPPAPPAPPADEPKTPATALALGSQPQPPTPPAPPADASAKDDEPLGPAGKKALEAEREARKALEAELKALAPLKELAAKLGTAPVDKPEDDTKDRVAALEKLLEKERTERLRLEVAKAKKLTDAQAALLVGTSAEELTAHADVLLSAFPRTESTPDQLNSSPATSPRPDPSQGATGQVDINALIAEAERTGDTMRAINLKRQRMLQNRT